MRNMIIPTHCLIAVGIQFGLKYIAEHLDVVSTCTIALAYSSIDITAQLINLQIKTEFR